MMPDLAPVITIDGPSGSGKGTVSRLLAEKLGWHLLDSGALYRLTALAATRQGLAMNDEVAISEMSGIMDIRFMATAEGTRVLLDGDEVTLDIRKESCGIDASRVAALPMVRASLLNLQHRFRRAPGLVADGRDMGTVVFPDATLKFFLTASLEERGKRRARQLKEQGVSANLPALLKDLSERDARDVCRAVSPLKPADGAMLIDSSDLDITDVMNRVLSLVRAEDLL